MSYAESAFDEVCRNARSATGHYVALTRETQRYGGPEEGGWWTSDTHIVRYRYFSTEEAARVAYWAVKELAEKLKQNAMSRYGEYCLASMDQAETRGLEASDLPEVDGPDDYFVTMTEGLPIESRGPTSYK